jgi:branched-chain amino acid aminotransferase
MAKAGANYMNSQLIKMEAVQNGYVTRDAVLTLAHELGITVVEQLIPREMLYLSDEVFFTGTAAEITPIRSVDKLPVGDGSVGPVTKKIRAELFGLFDGSKPDKYKWLTPVPVK